MVDGRSRGGEGCMEVQRWQWGGELQVVWSMGRRQERQRCRRKSTVVWSARGRVCVERVQVSEAVSLKYLRVETGEFIRV